MKKILTAFAMGLLLVACNTAKYDDSAIKERISSLERRMDAVEGSIQSLQSAIGDGVFVLKVEEYADPDTGKITGVTVTYTNGKVVHFSIEPAKDAGAPVFSAIRNAEGDLCWAVDGKIIQVGGQDVPIYQTPVFSVDEDGILWVEVNGQKAEIGPVKSGASLQDGVFTDVKVTQEAVVLTLADGSTVNIPFAEPFELKLEKTEFVSASSDPIVIPYTISGKTEKTVVDYISPNTFAFKVDIDEAKITITPVYPGASVQILFYADSKMGLTSLAKVTIESPSAQVTDEPTPEGPNYIAEGEGGTIEANIVSNVEKIDAESSADWITVVEVKAEYKHTITLKMAENNTGEYREDDVVISIMLDGKPYIIQRITVGQKAKEEGAKDLGKKGTANSYIVTGAGDYKFAAVKGNSTDAVGEVAKAEILWETWNTDEEVSANSVVASAKYADGFISFKVADGFHPGNAIIAAKDASDKILWSWHIWVPEEAVTTSTFGDLFGAGVQVMNLNLGALVQAKAPASPKSFGLLYQWGRKDPFVSAATADAKAEKAKVAGKAFEKSKTPITTAESIANPTMFAYNAETAVDPDWKGENWCSEENDKAWDETKTIYDPCPPGYLVPKRNSDVPFWGGASWTYDAANFLAVASEAAFPVGGILDDCGGGLAYTATRTIVWSSTSYSSDNKRARALQVRTDKSTADGTNAWKSRGATVRCVAE